MSLRIVFMGTPDFAVPTLTEIVGRGHEVVAVYTRAPKPAGRRGLEIEPTPVHRLAERFGIAVETPKSLKGQEAQALFAAHAADVAVVVAYGLLLPKAILDAPSLGCLNVHASLLPRWRGAAPIHRAVMAGDAETGVMIMAMEEGLDTGPVAMVERLAISPDATTGDLHDPLARLGADLCVRALAAFERGSLGFRQQGGEGVTYAKKIEKTETRIDWSRPAREIHNHIRGLSPFPGAWFELPATMGGGGVKVLRSSLGAGSGAPGTVLDETLTIACGDGAVMLTELQRAGSRALGAAEFQRGARLGAGTVLP